MIYPKRHGGLILTGKSVSLYWLAIAGLGGLCIVLYIGYVFALLNCIK